MLRVSIQRLTEQGAGMSEPVILEIFSDYV